MNASPLSLHADFILTHGRLITLDPARPTAPAIAIRDGTILAIGADEDMLRLAGPGACVVNLAGRTVIPGLIDADTEQIARIRDLLTASAESLAATSATMTIVGGRVVYD